jgi:hypothetical protein
VRILLNFSHPSFPTRSAPQGKAVADGAGLTSSPVAICGAAGEPIMLLHDCGCGDRRGDAASMVG